MRFFIWVLAMLAVAPAVVACECTPPPPPKKAAAKSDAVLSGKVIALDAMNGRWAKVTVEVAASYKGDAMKSTVLYTSKDGDACGYPFEAGKSYLIYAELADNEGEKVLRTTLCTRTRPLADAVEDLKELGEGTKPK